MSGRVITIDNHVTRTDRADGADATTSTCPTPGRTSHGSLRRIIHAGVGRAHLSAGRSTSTPSRMCCAPAARTANRTAPTIAHIWLDNGYTGSTVAHAATTAAVTVEIVSRPKPKSGFTVQPHRRVVERTNG